MSTKLFNLIRATLLSTFVFLGAGWGLIQNAQAQTMVTTNIVPGIEITMSATPAYVAPGGSAVVTWSAKNVTGSCFATGDNDSGTWSGEQQKSGSFSTGPLLKRGPEAYEYRSYNLRCSTAGWNTGVVEATMVVGVGFPNGVTTSEQGALPVIKLSLTPASVADGGSSLLSWSSNTVGPGYCVPVGRWLYNNSLDQVPNSGTQSIGPLSLSSSPIPLGLRCENAKGRVETMTSAVVTDSGTSVGQPAGPTISAVSPSSNASWAIGSTQTFKWKTTGTDNKNTVTIVLNSDNRFVYQGQYANQRLFYLAFNAPNTGSFSWKVGDSIKDPYTTDAQALPVPAGGYMAIIYLNGSPETGGGSIAHYTVGNIVPSYGEYNLVGGLHLVTTCPTQGCTTDSTTNTAPTSTISGCLPGHLYSSSTGKPCSTGTGTTTTPATSTGPITSTSPKTSDTTLPTTTLTASSGSVNVGDSVTLTWSSDNANRCVADGAWYGAKGISSTQTIPVTTAGAKTYGLTCSGPDGDAKASVTVSVGTGTPTPAEGARKKKTVDQNLKYGARDTGSSDDVTALQEFLKDNGYLNANATGFFGAMTLSAVKRFQAAERLPSTGFVGLMTREVMMKKSVIDFQTPLAPVVTISATPSSVVAGGSTKIIWSAKNATQGCVKSGDWLGTTEESSGTFTTPALSEGVHTYTLTCTGGMGRTGRGSAIATVSGTVGLPALTDSTQAGQFLVDSDSILQWFTKNATSCTASGTLNDQPLTDGSWSGDKPVSTPRLGDGVVRFKSAGTYVLFLNCTGPSGTSMLRIGNYIVSAPSNAPTITYSISPSSIFASNVSDSDHDKNPTDITLKWSSTNATSCGSSAGPAGNFGPSGTAKIYTISDPSLGGYYYYGLACSGPGGVMNRFFVIPTIETPPITVAISASPTSVSVDNPKWSVSWTSTGATSCTRSGGWDESGPTELSGSRDFNYSPLPSSYVGLSRSFGISCKAPGRSTPIKTATVTYTAGGSTTQPVISVSPAHVAVGGSATINWNLVGTTYSTCAATVKGPYAAETTWSGIKTGVGSQSSGPLNHDDAYIFGIGCDGVFGTSDGVTVGNTTLVVPAQLNAWPQQLRVGETTSLTWGATAHAKSCTAFDQWSGEKSASGGSEQVTVPSTPGSYTYTLACTPENGTAPQRGTQSSMVLTVTP